MRLKRRRKYCHQCGGSRWGLVRQYIGWLNFCSRTCRETFLAKRSLDLEKQRRWFSFLSRPP